MCSLVHIARRWSAYIVHIANLLTWHCSAVQKRGNSGAKDLKDYYRTTFTMEPLSHSVFTRLILFGRLILRYALTWFLPNQSVDRYQETLDIEDLYRTHCPFA